MEKEADNTHLILEKGKIRLKAQGVVAVIGVILLAALAIFMVQFSSLVF